LGIADRGRERRRVDRSDPRDRRQASHGFVFPRHADELRIKGRNALIERTPFAPQVFNQQADAGAQCLDPIFVGKDRELFLQFASALRRDDPALKQQRP
jgi:hypothetical protein